MLTLIFGSLAIFVCCNLFAVFASLLALYSNRPADKWALGRPFPPASVLWQRLPLIGLNTFILVVTIIVGLALGYGLFDFEWQGTLAVIAQILFLVFLDDAYFYFFHRALHRKPYLYKKFHQIHHRAVAPFALEYIYVHPLEWIIRAAAIPVGVGVIYFVNGSVSVHAFWAFALWFNFHEIDIHTGFRPFLARFVPFLATTEHHDRHHEKKQGNYGSTFTIWDRLLGTTISPT